jgi:hypothetical protein
MMDLLTRVLVADPAQRITMEDIKRHPWFLRGLPPGALEMNDVLISSDPGQPDLDQVSVCKGAHGVSSDAGAASIYAPAYFTTAAGTE